MLSKNNLKLREEKQANKVTRYSIKRLTVGTASVAVAACLFFAGGSVASAQELEATSEPIINNESSSSQETVPEETSKEQAEEVEATEPQVETPQEGVEEIVKVQTEPTPVEQEVQQIEVEEVAKEEKTVDAPEKEELKLTEVKSTNEGNTAQKETTTLKEEVVPEKVVSKPAEKSISWQELESVQPEEVFQLPTGASAKWIERPSLNDGSFKRPGEYSFKYEVTYADGTSEVVEEAIYVGSSDIRKPKVKVSDVEEGSGFRQIPSQNTQAETETTRDELVANWKEYPVDGNYWERPEGRNPRNTIQYGDNVVGFDMSYDGAYYDENNQLVLRGTMSDLMSGGTNYQEFRFYFSPELYDMIDWDKSNINSYHTGTSENPRKQYFLDTPPRLRQASDSLQTYERAIGFFDLTNANQGTKRTPINIVLKKGYTLNDVKDKDLMVQARLLNPYGTGKNAGSYFSNSNPSIGESYPGANDGEGDYNEYTMTMPINAGDKNTDLLPAATMSKEDSYRVRNITDIPVLFVTNSSTYDSETNTVNNLYGYNKNEWGYNGKLEGKNVGFYQKIDQDLYNSLADTGVVGQILLADTNKKDQTYDQVGNNKNIPVTIPVTFTKDDINYDPVTGDAYILVGSSDFASEQASSGSNRKVIVAANPDQTYIHAGKFAKGGNHTEGNRPYDKGPVYTKVQYKIDPDKAGSALPEGKTFNYLDFDTSFVYPEQSYSTVQATNNTGSAIIIQPNEVVEFVEKGLDWGTAYPNMGEKEGAQIFVTIGNDEESVTYTDFGYPGGMTINTGTQGARRKVDSVRRLGGYHYEFTTNHGITINPGDTVTISAPYADLSNANFTMNISEDISTFRNYRDSGLTFEHVEDQTGLPSVLNSRINSTFVIERSLYQPMVDDVYTDDTQVTGYSRYYNSPIAVEYTNPDGTTQTFDGTSNVHVYDGTDHFHKIGEGRSAKTGANATINVNGVDYRVSDYKVTIPTDLTLVKDAKITVTNEKTGTIPSDPTVAKVKAKVYFNLDGGQVGSSTSIDPVVAPENSQFAHEAGYTPNGLGQDVYSGIQTPTKPGYFFGGWQTQDGKDFTADTPITTDMTVTAKWMSEDEFIDKEFSDVVSLGDEVKQAIARARELNDNSAEPNDINTLNDTNFKANQAELQTLVDKDTTNSASIEAKKQAYITKLNELETSLNEKVSQGEHPYTQASIIQKKDAAIKKYREAVSVYDAGQSLETAIYNGNQFKSDLENVEKSTDGTPIITSATLDELKVPYNAFNTGREDAGGMILDIPNSYASDKADLENRLSGLADLSLPKVNATVDEKGNKVLYSDLIAETEKAVKAAEDANSKAQDAYNAKIIDDKITTPLEDAEITDLRTKEEEVDSKKTTAEDAVKKLKDISKTPSYSEVDPAIQSQVQSKITEFNNRLNNVEGINTDYANALNEVTKAEQADAAAKGLLQTKVANETLEADLSDPNSELKAAEEKADTTKSNADNVVRALNVGSGAKTNPDQKRDLMNRVSQLTGINPELAVARELVEVAKAQDEAAKNKLAEYCDQENDELIKPVPLVDGNDIDQAHTTAEGAKADAEEYVKGLATTEDATPGKTTPSQKQALLAELEGLTGINPDYPKALQAVENAKDAHKALEDKINEYVEVAPPSGQDKTKDGAVIDQNALDTLASDYTGAVDTAKGLIKQSPSKLTPQQKVDLTKALDALEPLDAKYPQALADVEKAEADYEESRKAYEDVKANYDDPKKDVTKAQRDKLVETRADSKTATTTAGTSVKTLQEGDNKTKLEERLARLDQNRTALDPIQKSKLILNPNNDASLTKDENNYVVVPLKSGVYNLPVGNAYSKKNDAGKDMNLVGYSGKINGEYPDIEKYQDMVDFKGEASEILYPGNKIPGTSISTDSEDADTVLHGVWKDPIKVNVTQDLTNIKYREDLDGDGIIEEVPLESSTFEQKSEVLNSLKDGFKVGLLERTAVGEPGKEVVHSLQAQYYPVKDSIRTIKFDGDTQSFKIYNEESGEFDDGISWERPGYDIYGQRLSYITVIAESPFTVGDNSETDFYNFKGNEWAKYSISVKDSIPANAETGQTYKPGEKTQIFTKQRLNSQEVDTFTSATSRTINVDPGLDEAYKGNFFESYEVELKQTVETLTPLTIDTVIAPDEDDEFTQIKLSGKNQEASERIELEFAGQTTVINLVDDGGGKHKVEISSKPGENPHNLTFDKNIGDKGYTENADGTFTLTIKNLDKTSGITPQSEVSAQSFGTVVREGLSGPVSQPVQSSKTTVRATTRPKSGQPTNLIQEKSTNPKQFKVTVKAGQLTGTHLNENTSFKLKVKTGVDNENKDIYQEVTATPNIISETGDVEFIVNITAELRDAGQFDAVVEQTDPGHRPVISKPITVDVSEPAIKSPTKIDGKVGTAIDQTIEFDKAVKSAGLSSKLAELGLTATALDANEDGYASKWQITGTPNENQFGSLTLAAKEAQEAQDQFSVEDKFGNVGPKEAFSIKILDLADKPEIKSVRDGDKEVIVEQLTDSKDKKVLPKDTEATVTVIIESDDGSDPISKTAELDELTGKLVAQLDQPLKAGQTIKVTATENGKAPVDADDLVVGLNADALNESINKAKNSYDSNHDNALNNIDTEIDTSRQTDQALVEAFNKAKAAADNSLIDEANETNQAKLDDAKTALDNALANKAKLDSVRKLVETAQAANDDLANLLNSLKDEVGNVTLDEKSKADLMAKAAELANAQAEAEKEISDLKDEGGTINPDTLANDVKALEDSLANLAGLTDLVNIAEAAVKKAEDSYEVAEGAKKAAQEDNLITQAEKKAFDDAKESASNLIKAASDLVNTLPDSPKSPDSPESPATKKQDFNKRLKALVDLGDLEVDAFELSDGTVKSMEDLMADYNKAKEAVEATVKEAEAFDDKEKSFDNKFTRERIAELADIQANIKSQADVAKPLVEALQALPQEAQDYINNEVAKAEQQVTDPTAPQVDNSIKGLADRLEGIVPALPDVNAFEIGTDDQGKPIIKTTDELYKEYTDALEAVKQAEKQVDNFNDKENGFKGVITPERQEELKAIQDLVKEKADIAQPLVNALKALPQAAKDVIEEGITNPRDTIQGLDDRLKDIVPTLPDVNAFEIGTDDQGNPIIKTTDELYKEYTDALEAVKQAEAKVVEYDAQEATYNNQFDKAAVQKLTDLIGTENDPDKLAGKRKAAQEAVNKVKDLPQEAKDFIKAKAEEEAKAAGKSYNPYDGVDNLQPRLNNTERTAPAENAITIKTTDKDGNPVEETLTYEEAFNKAQQAVEEAEKADKDAKDALKAKKDSNGNYVISPDTKAKLDELQKAFEEAKKKAQDIINQLPEKITVRDEDGNPVEEDFRNQLTNIYDENGQPVLDEQGKPVQKSLQGRLNDLKGITVPEVNDENGDGVIDADFDVAEKAVEAAKQAYQTYKDALDKTKDENGNYNITDEAQAELDKLKDAFDKAKEAAQQAVDKLGDGDVKTGYQEQVSDLAVKAAEDAHKVLKDALENTKDENGNYVISPETKAKLDKLKQAFEEAKQTAQTDIDRLPDNSQAKSELQKRLNALYDIEIPAVNKFSYVKTSDASPKPAASSAKSAVVTSDNAIVAAAKEAVAKAEAADQAAKQALEATKDANGNYVISPATQAKLITLQNAFEKAKRDAQAAVDKLTDGAIKSNLQSRLDKLTGINVPAVNDFDADGVIDSYTKESKDSKVQSADSLPETGESVGIARLIASLSSTLAGLGLIGHKKKEEDED